MKNKDDLFKEAYSAEYRNKIMSAADSEIEKLRPSSETQARRWWLFLGPVLASFAGGWWYFRTQKDTKEMAQLLDEDFNEFISLEELPDDLDLLEELEFIESLEGDEWEES